MFKLDSRYDLKIGELSNFKFYTLFDKKLFCIVYQIKINNGILEEYYPSHNIDNTKGKAKLSKNRIVPNNVKKYIISLAKKEIEPKKIFLVGCSAKKHNGLYYAEDLYNSTRIKWAKNLAYADETKSNLYILSAKYGIVSGKTILPNYDVIMTEQISKELYPKVLRQLILSNINEIVFFKAGINKNYYELIKKACDDLKIKLIDIGTGCMGGSKEIENILKVYK